MNRDVAMLESTARDLSVLGLDLSTRSAAPDVETVQSIGQALVALSEAVNSIAAALNRGAEQTRAVSFSAGLLAEAMGADHARTRSSETLEMSLDAPVPSPRR